MIRYILSFILFALPLSANLTYDTNSQKELALLNTFDIEPSFLYDAKLNEIREKTLQHKEHFFATMDAADQFIPIIKELLSESNIPQEFLYLAMAESNFRTKAYSNKRAAGLWQFMPITAKKYGLTINEYVDERRDLIKSTKAAARYLTFLYDFFGKWYLAAIAYNCGEGYLQNAINRAGSDKLSVLLDEEKKYIPLESRNYIRKIVALALIGSNGSNMLDSQYEHLLNRANASSIAAVHVAGGESLKRVAKIVDVSFDELQELNRHLKYNFAPPYKSGYDIYIPYDKLSLFKKRYKPSSVRSIYKVYVVKSGDNLIKIAKNYGISYKVIKEFNQLSSNRLRLKQKLVIPIPKNSKMAKIKSKNYYIVKKGDSLESIAKAHKISVSMIRQQNNIKGSLIRIGERLKIYE
jgi:membrane-bound lytic murein transglycosylase D